MFALITTNNITYLCSPKTLHALTQKMQQKITKKGVGWAPCHPAAHPFFPPLISLHSPLLICVFNKRNLSENYPNWNELYGSGLKLSFKMELSWICSQRTFPKHQTARGVRSTHLKTWKHWWMSPIRCYLFRMWSRKGLGRLSLPKVYLGPSVLG